MSSVEFPANPEEAKGYDRLMGVIEQNLAVSVPTWGSNSDGYHEPDEVESMRGFSVSGHDNPFEGVNVAETVSYRRRPAPSRLLPLRKPKSEDPFYIRVERDDVGKARHYRDARLDVLQRDFEEPEREIVVYRWEDKDGAERPSPVWRVAITPKVDLETVEAIVDLIGYKTDGDDPRFDRYRIGR